MAQWMAVSTAQAVITTAAGVMPSDWWALHVWAPMEVLVLIAFGMAAVEAMPGAHGIALLGSGIVALPLAWIVVPADAGLYPAFLQAREWLRLTVALAMTAHVIGLFIHPEPFPPAVYRARCILAAAAVANAAIAPIMASTPQEWISARAIYRAAIILCCVRWAMLAPRMRQATHWCREA